VASTNGQKGLLNARRISGCLLLSSFCRRPPYRSAKRAVSGIGLSGSMGLNAS